MSDKTCPQCGAPVTGGGFCSSCGASLEPRPCPSCGEESPPGSRFCTSCGSSLAAPRAASAKGEGEGNGGLGWWVAGLVLVALILFLLVPVIAPDRGLQEPGAPVGAPPGGGAPAAGGAPSVDLSSMTPREAADRLFNRIMQAGEEGDTAEVFRFLPMATAAYERARPLDADGLFHLSVLQRTANDYQAALQTASSGLEDSPDHLLLLSAAGEAARQLEDSAAARQYFGHLLEVWEEERNSGLEEYQLHASLLPRIRSDAEEFLNGG